MKKIILGFIMMFLALLPASVYAVEDVVEPWSFYASSVTQRSVFSAWLDLTDTPYFFNNIKYYSYKSNNNHRPGAIMLFDSGARFYPGSDAECGGYGDLSVGFTVPHSGNWKYEISVSNFASAGAHGGLLSVYKFDGTKMTRMDIDRLPKPKKESVEFSADYSFECGEMLLFMLSSDDVNGGDGARFEVNITVTDGEGCEYNLIGADGFDTEIRYFINNEDCSDRTLLKGDEVRVSVSRPVSEDKTMTCCAGVYDLNGKLEKLSIQSADKETSEITLTLGIDSNGMTIKTFVWESLETMIPLCKSKIIGKYDDGSFSEKVWDFSESVLNVSDVWEVYTSSNAAVYFSDYQKLSLNMKTQTLAIYSIDGTEKPASLYWSDITDRSGVSILPIEDSGAVDGKGKIIISFTAPESGNYDFSATVKNIGRNAFGGDGGAMNFMYLAPEQNVPKSILSVPLQTSYDTEAVLNKNTVVNMNQGDRLLLSISCGGGGYADKFYLDYKATYTNTDGKTYTNSGIADLIPQPKGERKAAGADISDNQVWMGFGANLTDGMFLEENLSILQKYIKNLGINVYSNRPDLLENAEYFSTRNIPVMIQNYITYKEYYNVNDSWERNWKNESASPDCGAALAGTGHAAALPATAVREALKNNVITTSENGFSAYGYTDYVWMYGFPSGRMGYHPETILAFRDDLNENDEGLRLTIGGDDEQAWHFWDYAKYYTGEIMLPDEIGFESWDEYVPLLYSQYLKNTSGDYTQQNLLFDLLISYEWLKAAQYYGNVAKENDIKAQVLPNNEDVGNGGDTLFLGALADVDMVTNEFFREPEFIDGAYYHMPYLMSHVSEDKSYGLVMECGNGGNAYSYYENEIGYLTAYELASATELDHFEVDWWPSINAKPEDIKEQHKDRYQIALSYAIGYEDAEEDGLSPINSDFISVTARRQNRPWSGSGWEWRLSYQGSPEAALARHGYVFEGVAQDGMDSIPKGQKLIVYSPYYPQEKSMKKILEMTESGDVENVIMNGKSLEKIVCGYKFKNMSTVYPELSLKKETLTKTANLIDMNGNILCEDIAFDGSIYTPADMGFEVVMSLGNSPVLIKKSKGNGKLYIALFDPNSNEDLTQAVYEYVLGGVGIKRRWITDDATGQYLEGYEQSAKSFENQSSVRVYGNSDGKVIAMQHPMGRRFCTDSGGNSIVPYKINGVMNTKVLLEPLKEYTYVSMPEGITGSITADENGYVELSCENVTHQLFWMFDANDNPQEKIENILNRKLIFEDAMTVNGMYK